MHAGLSFEQAPPLSVPLRFLLTAPAFLFAAGLLLVFYPEALASRWTPQALALTHTLTLGFLAMVMLGALMQMLPVVAGAILPAGRAVAGIGHVSLALGTLALVAGFLLGAPAAFGVASVLLAAGFSVFLLAAALGLARAVTNETVAGIRYALLGLALAAGLGIVLALVRAVAWMPAAIDAVRGAHVVFGLLGWVLLLVIGVAYQVVPMFQITPPYPPWLARRLAGAIAALLVAHAASAWLLPEATPLVEAGLAGAVVLFAVTTLRLQARRRRTLPDVTLDFWRVGMASLLACVALWSAARLWPALAHSDAHAVLQGVLFLGGFAVSVVTGMLYKIVPFLAWFHLQAQLQAKAGSIPTMKDMIAARAMRWQFRLHLAACALLVGAALWAPLTAVAGGVLALSAGVLWLNLFSATRRFAGHGGLFS
ncbi:MAG: hypothetical protein AB1720_09390 [Pseudomonadota bacterium]